MNHYAIQTKVNLRIQDVIKYSLQKKPHLHIPLFLSLCMIHLTTLLVDHVGLNYNSHLQGEHGLRWCF